MQRVHITIIKDNNTAPTVLTIPDNPTNGDVITAMFPDVHYVLASQGTPRVVTNLGASFDLDWWNSSYKENTDGSNN